MNQLLARWGDGNRSIMTNAGAQAAATIVAASLGFLYWWAAARHFTPDVVGLAASAISAMLLLGMLGTLGLGTLLIGELPRYRGREGSLILPTLSLAAATGTLLGGAFALVFPYLSPDFGALVGSPSAGLLFALGVGLTSVSVVVDQALIGLLRGGEQLWRNALFAFVKLCVLLGVGFWLEDRHGMSIYATWAVGNLISLLALILAALTRGATLSAHRPHWALLRSLGRSALGHHALNMILQAPLSILPVIVTALLSPSANAYFYSAVMLARFALLGPITITTALFATGARNPAALAERVRFTLRLSLAAGLISSAALLVGADFVLGWFGPAYAEHAGSTLRILGLAVFPLIVKDHFVAIYRVHNRVSRAALILGPLAVIEILAAALGGAIGGLVGLSLGWAIAVSAEGVVLLRPVWASAGIAEVPHGRPAGETGHAPLTVGAAKGHGV